MTGTILSDQEIDTAIQDGLIRIERATFSSGQASPFDPQTAIQPCSLDLTIGRIMEPQCLDDKRESKITEQKSIKFAPGATIVVETAEKLTIDKKIGGFGFPPARLARDGILMTNPGHIDPGYSGTLSFTLINMGRTRRYLQEGDRVATFLFYQFKTPVDKGFEEMQAGKPTTRKYSKILKRLAPDFANTNERIAVAVDTAVTDRLKKFEQEADKAKASFESAKLTIPALGAAAGAFLAIISAFFIEWMGRDYAASSEVLALQSQLEHVATELDAVGSSQYSAELHERILMLEQQVAEMASSN